MAAKKVAKKVAKKTSKPAPKKTAAKKTIKPALKKKVTVPPAKKIPAKPAAPVSAVPPVAAAPATLVRLPFRLPSAPAAVAVAAAPALVVRLPGKPAASPVVRTSPPPPKVRSKGDPKQDYRGQRKYTVVKLQEIYEHSADVRTAIGAEASDGELAVWELLQYLATIEESGTDWKKKRSVPNPDGTPKRRGRPSKKAAEAQAGVVTASKTPGATLAAAAAGKLVPPRASNGAIAAKPAFRLPVRPTA